MLYAEKVKGKIKQILLDGITGFWATEDTVLGTPP
jgi:hypothetical protein